MDRQYSASAAAGGLSVKAYAGDRCVMLAFDLDDNLTDKLAGFAIARRRGGSGAWTPLGNRLGFQGNHTDASLSPQGKFFPSTVAPFQKFWWLDFPADGQYGTWQYQVTAMRFVDAAGASLKPDQQVSIAIDVGPFAEGSIELAFTRGYLSSQAYADRFKNAPAGPTQHASGWQFDTGPFQERWAWLGGHARQAVIDFFTDCRNDPACKLDAFVYDLNEPDVISAFLTLAPRLRVLADNSKTHAPASAAGQARADMEKAGATLMEGKFGRFQHNKVLIKRDRMGKALKVLTGSTNFSITGLYVNANHVVVFDDPAIAQKYADYFDAAWKAQLKAPAMQADPITHGDTSFTEPGLPRVDVSFAPHKPPTDSLDALLERVKGAQSSVIFAVMDLDGKGDLLSALKNLHDDPHIFSYGITDSPDVDPQTGEQTGAVKETRLHAHSTRALGAPQTQGAQQPQGGVLVYSKENPTDWPAPFAAERLVTGAAAHVVHHKFVVVDFNGDNPVVYCGSSNLATGGEEQNGDNLIALYDRNLATAFAIEGIRLVDHYVFAAALKHAGAGQPLRLKTDSEKWWAPYYQPGSIKETERKLFAR